MSARLHRCLAEDVRTELYAAGARPRTAALSGAGALTASERRVAALAAEGASNRDIAQTLFVTPKTVEVHLSNVYRKLGIRSRRELSARSSLAALTRRAPTTMSTAPIASVTAPVPRRIRAAGGARRRRARCWSWPAGG